jgi:hypothetical protein
VSEHSKGSKKKTALIVGAVFVAVAGISALLSALFIFDSDDEGSAELDRLTRVANEFPVPVGAEVAFPDTTQSDPPTAVKGWRSPDQSLDKACAAWRDSFRDWVDTSDPDTIEGQVTEGQSCTLSGTRDGSQADLVIAVYGSEPPQATLAIKETVDSASDAAEDEGTESDK